MISRTFLTNVRSFLEQRWEERRLELSRPEGVCVDEGMCRFAAHFVASLLRELDGDAWQMVGGDREEHAGFRDQGGVWHSHYWATDGRVIIDLACVQFGQGPVVITGVDDRRYRPSYRDHELRAHAYDVRNRVASWLDCWEREQLFH